MHGTAEGANVSAFVSFIDSEKPVKKQVSTSGGITVTVTKWIEQ